MYSNFGVMRADPGSPFSTAGASTLYSLYGSTLLTWKWPGSLDFLPVPGAGPAILATSQLMSSNASVSSYKCLTKYLACIGGLFMSAPNLFSAGEPMDTIVGTHSTQPGHLVGWGEGYPLPIPQPLDSYTASRPEFHFLKVGNLIIDLTYLMSDCEFLVYIIVM